MKRRHVWLVSFAYVVFIALVVATPAFAHEQPDGANWLMADWMLLSFLVFFGMALIAFVIALKRGYLSNLECTLPGGDPGRSHAYPVDRANLDRRLCCDPGWILLLVFDVLE
jgi:hypothetical protein